MKAKTIEPPTRRGRRAESIDTELVESAADLLSKGNAATDGRTYKTRGRAQSAAARLRGAVVAEFEFTPEQIGTRVWGEGEEHHFAIVNRTA